MVRYNKSLGKMMLVGSFTEYDGQERKQVVMLNSDGTLDSDFKLKEMTGGSPNFAQLIDRARWLCPVLSPLTPVFPGTVF